MVLGSRVVLAGGVVEVTELVASVLIAVGGVGGACVDEQRECVDDAGGGERPVNDARGSIPRRTRRLTDPTTAQRTPVAMSPLSPTH